MKMTAIRLILLCLSAICFTSCKKQKTPEQLFEERASGVVVVLNEYYYQIKLPNGNKVFFTGFDEDGNLENFTPDEDEIEKNRKMMTGTGFFVDKNGSIMTNRHVAEPQLDMVKAKSAYVRLVRAMTAVLEYGKSQMEEQYAALESQKSDCTYYDYEDGTYYYDRDKLQEINDKQNELEESYEELDGLLENLSDLTDPSALKISSKCKIGIALNDTYVTSIDDFLGANECVVTDISEKEDVDLALIQLKNKTTPKQSFVFDVTGKYEDEKSWQERITDSYSNEEDDGQLKINQQLYMIGYNAGLVLGSTKQGIKVQMTSGKLTQSPDGQRLLYSIPTMQGSSGSPVIDERGRLVGVNFAKLNGTDNFNFGIPIERVRDFYDKSY